TQPPLDRPSWRRPMSCTSTIVLHCASPHSPLNKTPGHVQQATSNRCSKRDRISSVPAPRRRRLVRSDDTSRNIGYAIWASRIVVEHGVDGPPMCPSRERGGLGEFFHADSLLPAHICGLPQQRLQHHGHVIG